MHLLVTILIGSDPVAHLFSRSYTTMSTCRFAPARVINYDARFYFKVNLDAKVTHDPIVSPIQ